MEFRKYLAIGTGVGIEIRERDLEIAVARVRPPGVEVTGRTSIRRYADRPAAEWGSEYSAFVKQQGVSHLSAILLLPRRDVIVRQLALPGVAAKDIPSAIAFQLDSLHPYGEDEVASGWTALGNGVVLVGVIRKSTLDRYLAAFSEAGVSLASCTFSAAALHAALRIYGAPAVSGFVAIAGQTEDGIEVYGESGARPVFSAQFETVPERAIALAASELRLSPDVAPAPLEKLLPVPRTNPVENDLYRDPLPYAAALAAACPRLAPAANLLPPERRATNSRAMLIPTAVLGGLLLIAAGALVAHSSIEDRQYIRKLDDQIRQLEPIAKRSAAFERELDKTRARTRLLDEFRGRSKADLDALNELTQLLPPPIWTSQLELTRDTAVVAGEADQAAALLKVIDGSPLFQNSEFTNITRTGNSENFRIQTKREARR